MRQLEFSAFGKPLDVLSLRDVALGELAPGLVRVRVRLSPIHPSDILLMKGEYGWKPPLPAVPGFELVGHVCESRAGWLGRRLLGKRVVVADANAGCWKEYVDVPAWKCLSPPSLLSDEQAAQSFVNPASAWLMLQEAMKVLPDQREKWGSRVLLQSAANGSVGRLIAKMGQQRGLEVLNVVRSKASREALVSGGFSEDRVFVFDADDSADGAETLTNWVQEKTAGREVGAVLDPVGGSLGRNLLQQLGERGIYISYGTLSGEPMEVDCRREMTQGLKIKGFWLSQRLKGMGLFGKWRLVRSLRGWLSANSDFARASRVVPVQDWAEGLESHQREGRAETVLLKFDVK